MKMTKKISPVDKTLCLSFTFNPEEYVLKDWEFMDRVNDIIIREILDKVGKKYKKEIMDFFERNKEKIIAKAKLQLIQDFEDKMERIIDPR